MAEEVVNGVPFTSQWSFLVFRYSSPSQEMFADGYFEVPPITMAFSLFSLSFCPFFAIIITFCVIFSVKVHSSLFRSSQCSLPCFLQSAGRQRCP